MMQQAASRVDFNRKSSLLPAWTKCKSRVSWVQCVTLSKVQLSEIFMHPKDSERTLWPAPDVPLIYICIFLQSMRDCNSRLLAKALFFSTDAYGCYFITHSEKVFKLPTLLLPFQLLCFFVQIVFSNESEAPFHLRTCRTWRVSLVPRSSLVEAGSGIVGVGTSIVWQIFLKHIWKISCLRYILNFGVDAANRLPKDSIRKTWIKEVRAMLVCRDIEHSKNWGPCEIFCHYDHYQYCFFMARIFQE